MQTAVGVDIGGTKIAAGLVASDGLVLTRARRDTPRDADAIAPLVGDLVVELRATVPGTPPSTAVGVGAAGIIDPDGTVRYAPNIAWADYPLGAELRRLLGQASVTVDNDANVAAWGEYRAGAGRDARSDMLMLTIGTGVGGGVVVGDRLLRGAHGFGAELGHVIVDEGGPPCPCGNRGCLEAVASGSAIGRAAREHLDAQDPSGVPTMGGAAAATVTGKAVTHAAQDGDERAVAIFEGVGFWLGVGIASLVNALDPEVVVVGGGAMEAGDLLLAPARESFAQRVIGRGHRVLPPVRPATLADDAGVVGAALLALQGA